MIKVRDIIWLGGLLEGEGWFVIKKEKYPTVGVSMTAEDTIVKVSDMWDTRIYHRGNQWRTQVNGARAVGWMLTLYPLLGRCRQKRIIEIIRLWQKHNHTRAPRGMWSMAKCHPDRKVAAFDLCMSCYMEQYHKKHSRKKQLLEKAG